MPGRPRASANASRSCASPSRSPISTAPSARRCAETASSPPMLPKLATVLKPVYIRESGGASMADIVLISPKFEISFWGLEHAMPLLGKRANMPVAALPLIAALTPAHHSVTIIDENVEEIDFARCAKADIVGLTGMIVQRRRMREILAELRRRKCYTVVG